MRTAGAAEDSSVNLSAVFRRLILARRVAQSYLSDCDDFKVWIYFLLDHSFDSH